MPPASKKRKTLVDYCSNGYNAVTGVENEAAIAFDSNEFQALLYRWILADNVSFRKIESENFHDLLKYLNPRCKSILPSHQTTSRTIGAIYDKQLGSLTETLVSLITNTSLSFDLWISKNKLASLGIVAHFINSKGEPTTCLLGWP